MAITNGPLKGIRILDLTQAHAGPFGTMLLGDLGSEVIKIEPPKGEMMRGGDPVVSPNQAYMIGLNRNKKCIVLDLKGKLGKKAFYDLVKTADVVYTNNRVDVAERIGTDYETLKKINPGIIRCNISGYGETGPYIGYPSFDIIACGHGGMLSISGEPDREPVIPGGIAIADMMGGIFCTMSVLAALVRRCNTGKGMKIDVNLIDGLLVMQQVLFQRYFQTGVEPGPQGQKDPLNPGIGIYNTKEGCMTLNSPNLTKLLKLIGLDSKLNDESYHTPESRKINKDSLNKLIEEALMKKTAKDWIKYLRDEHGIACGPILSLAELVEDPQGIFNKMILEMNLKGEKYNTIGSCFRLRNDKDLIEGYPEPPGNLGEHTEEVLAKLLRYTKEQVAQIINESTGNNIEGKTTSKITLVYENQLNGKDEKT